MMNPDSAPGLAPYITLHSHPRSRSSPPASTAAHPSGRDGEGGLYRHEAWGGPQAATVHGPSGLRPKPATHDISRVSFHVKNIAGFATTLENSARRAFPNRGRAAQRRYSRVRVLLIRWESDDLFVMPELEYLDTCFRQDYLFETEQYAIPSDNAHLELMMRICRLIKENEGPDTLLIVYYGGHAKIDESRQSTWIATRQPGSPCLQWSAIQTLLERSVSDVLILLDCCSGAASAAFPTGRSITETISASSWDAIAPDPGRYSFSAVLLEVLHEWRLKTFSAAMLHAEILARLKHPRPIMVNGRMCESRATPVHFMMTSNHKAASIEIARNTPDGWAAAPAPHERPGGPGVDDDDDDDDAAAHGRGGVGSTAVSGPDEDRPHVLISLALEDDQELDLGAWEQWLAAFPALARFVRVQGVFKSHSTLLLLSMPVTIWNLLPEDHATSFVAFVRSDNLAVQRSRQQPPPRRVAASVPGRAAATAHLSDGESFVSGRTTLAPSDTSSFRGRVSGFSRPIPALPPIDRVSPRAEAAALSETAVSGPSPWYPNPDRSLSVQLMKQRSGQLADFEPGTAPECPRFAARIEARLETYYGNCRRLNTSQRDLIASNLGVESFHVEVWFHHRRLRGKMEQKLKSLALQEKQSIESGATLISPEQLCRLLEVLPSEQILILDLRTPREYAASHIPTALNMRVPAGFIKQASLQLVVNAFTDEENTARFSAWRSTRCMVLYTAGATFAWECPAAEALLAKFRAEGWSGHCFVLRGWFPEGAASDGVVRTEQIADEIAGPNLGNTQAAYETWYRQVQGDNGRTVPPAMDAAAKTEVLDARDRREQEIQDEFIVLFPDLYKAAQQYSLQPKKAEEGKFDLGAPLVEPLGHGLAKLRDAGSAAVAADPPVDGEPPPASAGTTAKLAAMEGPGAGDGRRSPSDEFVKIVPEEGRAGDGESPGKRGSQSPEPAAQPARSLRKTWKGLRLFRRGGGT